MKIKKCTQIGFINPDTGKEDETEFDTKSAEAINLFKHDFCEDNHWLSVPRILYITEKDESFK